MLLSVSVLCCLFQIFLSILQYNCILFFNKSPFQVDVAVQVDSGFQESRYLTVSPGGSEHWRRLSWNDMHIKRTSSPEVNITVNLYHNGYVHFYKEEHVTAAQVNGWDHIRVRIPKWMRKREDRTKYGLDDSKTHIVITGNSGTGKSSFINLIRDIDDSHIEAAAVGETETTMHLQKYNLLKYPQINLWDTPGTGTPRFPLNEYFEGKSIYIFDSVMIMSATRFTEGEHNIVREAMDWSIPVFLIRNKAKIDYDNRKRRKIQESEQQFIDEMKMNITKHLNQADILRAHIYVIDTHYPEMFEYRKLKQHLLSGKNQSDKKAL